MTDWRGLVRRIALIGSISSVLNVVKFNGPDLPIDDRLTLLPLVVGSVALGGAIGGAALTLQAPCRRSVGVPASRARGCVHE